MSANLIALLALLVGLATLSFGILLGGRASRAADSRGNDVVVPPRRTAHVRPSGVPRQSGRRGLDAY
jgi:hypothetical protein